MFYVMRRYTDRNGCASICVEGPGRRRVNTAIRYANKITGAYVIDERHRVVYANQRSYRERFGDHAVLEPASNIGLSPAKA